MKKASVLMIVVFMLVVGIQNSEAQFIPGISELTGFGGMTFGSTNKATAGIALSANLTPHWAVEGEVGAIFASDTLFNINGGLIVNLGSGASLIVPYVVGGAGILDNGTTEFSLNAGAGLKLFMQQNWAFRLDFRVFFTSVSGDIKDMERLYGGIDLFF